MPTGVGDNVGEAGTGNNAPKLLASPTNIEKSRVKGTPGKRDSREAFTTTPSSGDKSMPTSRQGLLRGECLPGGRLRRSSSVVIYPEDDEVNKPKIFARQSFIVSGEEEEMAETILKARHLAGERRRSSIKLEDVTGKQGEIAALAQNLAERRNSLTKADVSLATASATTAAARADIQAAAVTDPAEDHASSRRRSSILNRIPDNLRALVQQSDASGVQQKVESPYPHHKVSVTKSVGRSDTVLSAQGPRKTRAIDSAPPRRWFQKLMSFMQLKSLRIKKTRQSSKGSSGGKRKNRGDYVMPISTPTPASYEKNRSLLPSQLPMFAGRKKLVLDLDETLVHSSFKPVPGADFILDIDVEGTPYKVFVRKRPGVDEFLKRMARQYEVIVFTASLPAYANPLLDLLDPEGYIESRLFREHCTFHEGYFVKDLALLRHESLESTIIVDNSPMAFMFQPENAIDCLSWIDDRNDIELYVIADFLEAIVDVPDVRDLLEFWREGGNVLQGI